MEAPNETSNSAPSNTPEDQAEAVEPKTLGKRPFLREVYLPSSDRTVDFYEPIGSDMRLAGQVMQNQGTQFDFNAKLYRLCIRTKDGEAIPEQEFQDMPMRDLAALNQVLYGELLAGAGGEGEGGGPLGL